MPKRISEKMNNRLLRQPNIEKVKVVVFELGGLKTPGPNGLLSVFYQKYWEVLVGERSSSCALIF